MSVQSEINRITNNVAAAYAAAAEKGADTPAAANSENLADTIRGIVTVPTLQNKTVTPGTSDQSVTADAGYDGLETVTVKGDANLKAENILSGTSIFGVPGSAESGAKVASGTVTAPARAYMSFTIPLGVSVNSLVGFVENNKFGVVWIDNSGYIINTNADSKFTLKKQDTSNGSTFTTTVAMNMNNSLLFRYLATS